jgi:hypothetical protein
MQVELSVNLLKEEWRKHGFHNSSG